MKLKAFLPLVALVALSACETPWYKLQRENDELRAENERLMSQQTGFEQRVLTAEEKRLLAEKKFSELANRQTEQEKTIADLKAKLAGTGMTVKEVNGRPAIVLPHGVFFNSGKHTLNTSGKTALKKVAQTLNSKFSNFVISVEGHTDSDPIRRSSYQDNYQLSAERAREVLLYLNKSGGVKLSRMSGAFHGPNKPVSTNKTPTGKKKNRRVELVLIG